MQGVASGSWPALAGAPTIGTATAGALNASVAFTAPTYTGSGITGYTATSSPGGITGTGASSPITVSGLTAGTAYTFTVTATTAAGQSSASAASNSVTPTPPVYIEDIYSTYLYTGNSSTQTITNGIDLSGKGGLVWLKGRSVSAVHTLVDTARCAGKTLFSDLTNAQATNNAVSAFNSNGFTMGDYNNTSPDTYVSWTFRKQPKFFDVVTWSGDDAADRQISHSLGSVPGCIIVKRTDASATWRVWHQNMVSNPANLYQYQLNLNTTNAVSLTYGEVWGTSNNVTSTTFQVGNLAAVNASGGTYVAYVFAHNAGGFGLTGTDNVISCGSVATTNSQQDVSLGYEPQWILWKRADSTGSWWMFDTMRGLVVDGGSGTGDKALFAELANAELGTAGIDPTATGFQLSAGWGAGTYIYIAIRRGPMKVPTSGTSVFNALSRTGTAATATVSTTILPDLVMSQARGGMYNVFYDRLRGAGATLSPNLGSDAESVVTNGITAFNNTSYTVGSDASQNRINWNTYTYANWLFSRAPSFFDEVCYTGTGTYGAANHNLGVTPELIIYKSRSNAVNWGVIKLVSSIAYYDGLLNSNSAFTYYSNDPSVAGLYTSTQFCKYQDTSSYTYVAYLFATCAGVSKVGSYTGTGATQTINCGFGAGGSRFVLIKRTDSTGDWYVWDSARGMVSGTDPSLLLNSTAAEVNANSIYTISTGFQIVSTAAGINASGGTYIFLSIA